MLNQSVSLEPDRRLRQGGYLFLASLVVFFIATIALYGIYAFTRRDDAESRVALPASLLISTGLLVAITVLVQWAVHAIIREKRQLTSGLLLASALLADLFVAVQFLSMSNLLLSPAMFAGTSKGVAGMIVVLAFLHALHVAGGILSLGIVAVRSFSGSYDHERHWPVRFVALYWHFLDLVWICMLVTFYLTTGGFGPS
jgi:cytochrome c oxidase subunit 3